MNFFEEQLTQGVFQICDCKKCNSILWPPRDICNLCNEKTSWHKSSEIGTIIEFSKKDSIFFGLIEIDNGIRIIGKISSEGTPKIGQQVKMNAGFEKRPKYSFTVENN